jgi:hypothetical protein
VPVLPCSCCLSGGKQSKGQQLSCTCRSKHA